MTVRHPEKVNNIEHPIQKKPAWIRVKASYSKEYTETKNIFIVDLCPLGDSEVMRKRFSRR